MTTYKNINQVRITKGRLKEYRELLESAEVQEQDREHFVDGY